MTIDDLADQVRRWQIAVLRRPSTDRLLRLEEARRRLAEAQLAETKRQLFLAKSPLTRRMMEQTP